MDETDRGKQFTLAFGLCGNVREREQEREWSEEELVPISALNQYSYCPRRCFYIHVSGEFMDNEHTLAGTFLHERVHSEKDSVRGDILELRSRYLFSRKYGLVGRADLIEVNAGEYRPVEYKKGRRGDWDNDEVQLCAQALALEEALGRPVPEGYIFYAASGRRKKVLLDEQLRQRTVRLIEDVRQLLVSQSMPPAIYGPRCRGCSVYPVCLPAEVERLKKSVSRTED
ncbi:MAG: CRISPR-associated protein Cas4 [Desulfurispora sp.]|uniref:CRISPR-associated protein Cas4 n=1 Tax=Desulfurispora sp. TaxID=3014275 RepID=UPI00404A12D9